MKREDISPAMVMSVIRVVLLRTRLRRRIEIDFATRVGPDCRIIVAKGGILRLRGATLKRLVTLEVTEGAVMDIGRAYFGTGTVASARERITMGDDGGLAEYSTVRDHDHLHDAENPLTEWRYRTDPVTIGNDVWIAGKVTVVAGVTIGDHAVCGANAVVTHDVEAWQRVGGVPARPLGSARKPAPVDSDFAAADGS